MSGMLSDVVEKMNGDKDTDERLAIVADGAFTYRDLDEASRRVAVRLLDGRRDLEEARVAYVARPGFALAALQRGIWLAGGVAVPLAVGHPPAERDYVVQDAGARLVDPGDLLGARCPTRAAHGRGRRRECWT